ncbi:MAG: RNA 2',3'-cyclic phosphodiesterase [Candidatus Krumholzibacteriia bacterium]
MRLFLAVDFADTVKTEIHRAIDALEIPHPPWRWVSAANLHMTLKFLGETPRERVGPLCECAEKVCRSVEPFTIRLGRLGAFPGISRPRVLFYEVEQGAASLRSLAEALDTALSGRMGLPRDERPFQAHATVARVKKPLRARMVTALRAAPPLAGVSQTVESVTLFESALRPKGPIYHHLKGFALAKSKC